MSIDHAIAAEQVATLITRDSMIGTGLPKSPEEHHTEAAR